MKRWVTVMYCTVGKSLPLSDWRRGIYVTMLQLFSKSRSLDIFSPIVWRWCTACQSSRTLTVFLRSGFGFRVTAPRGSERFSRLSKPRASMLSFQWYSSLPVCLQHIVELVRSPRFTFLLTGLFWIGAIIARRYFDVGADFKSLLNLKNKVFERMTFCFHEVDWVFLFRKAKGVLWKINFKYQI